MEEEQIRNYIILRSRMYKVRQDINEVIEKHEKIITDLKKALLINDEIIEQESFSKNYKDLNNLKSSINSVLSSINNKV